MIDANNNFYPLAFGVTHVKNSENWLFFMQNLRLCVPDAAVVPEKRELGLPMTFMSDRQKGLITAVKVHWKDAHHGHCFRHLLDNYKKKFRLVIKGRLTVIKAVRNALYSAATSSA